MNWRAASAFEPSSYTTLLAESTAVVHTIGTLYQNSSYKQAIRSGNLPALLQAIASGHGSNPLNTSTSRSSYQALNHDSGELMNTKRHWCHVLSYPMHMFYVALKVLNAFLVGSSTISTPKSQKTFVYISAEDIFGPLVPREYITSKRAAEKDIAAACRENAAAGVRAVSLRPGKSSSSPFPRPPN